LKSNVLKEERYHSIIREYIEHCQSLEFKQKPDYEYLIDLCERYKK